MALTGPHGGVLSNLYPDAVARDAQRKTLQALRASGRARGQLRDADMLLGEALFPLKGFLGRAARACAPGRAPASYPASSRPVRSAAKARNDQKRQMTIDTRVVSADQAARDIRAELTTLGHLRRPRRPITPTGMHPA